MVGLPWDFLILGAIVMLPRTIKHWIFNRPKQRRIEKMQEANRLFWSIRNKEMELYGQWYHGK